VLDSAFDHLERWIQGGPPAPVAPRLQRDPNAPRLFDPAATGGTAPGYATDAIGNTAGGIQLAEYALPNAEIKGAGTTGPGSCWLTGKHRWFTGQELSARYPDPGSYLRSTSRLTASNVSRGFILREDAARTLHDARTVYRQLLHVARSPK
jgi:hypothetical protein